MDNTSLVQMFTSVAVQYVKRF